MFPLDGDPHHGQCAACPTDGKIQALGIGQGVRCGTGVLVIFIYPFRHGFLGRCQERGHIGIFGEWEAHGRQKSAVSVRPVDHQVPFQQMPQLLRGDGEDLLCAFGSL